MSTSALLCDVLDNQRKLTKWYLKKIPSEIIKVRMELNDKSINSPLWNVAHLIWTDYNIGLFPLGYKEEIPNWISTVGFGSSGELPADLPEIDALFDLFDSVHQKKLDYFKTLDEKTLNSPYAITSLGFKNNYFALLHLARHEGIHAGGIATFCKLNGIKTV